MRGMGISNRCRRQHRHHRHLPSSQTPSIFEQHHLLPVPVSIPTYILILSSRSIKAATTTPSNLAIFTYPIIVNRICSVERGRVAFFWSAVLTHVCSYSRTPLAVACPTRVPPPPPNLFKTRANSFLYTQSSKCEMASKHIARAITKILRQYCVPRAHLYVWPSIFDYGYIRRYNRIHRPTQCGRVLFRQI